MLDYTNFDLSCLMLDMMCAEDAIFILVSKVGNIISQTSAAEKIFRQPVLRPICEILSENTANSLKTAMQTNEKINTIEIIDDNLYRLEIRPCKQGMLLYFKPAQNLFQGLPSHTQHVIKNAISRNLTAVSMLKIKGFDNTILSDIQKNSLRIERELMHLQILENNKDIEILMSPKQNDVVSICYNIVSECRKTLFEKGLDISFEFSSPDMLVAVFDKTLFEIAIFNILISSIFSTAVSKIFISIYKKNDMVYIDIHDNSNGIPQEYIDMIGSDYLLNISTNEFITSNQDGINYAFSLSVVKKIANLHKGVLKISSTDEGYDLIQFIFPYENTCNMSVNQTVDICGFNVSNIELSVL